MEREFRVNWAILVEEAVRRRHKLKLTQKQLAALAKISTPTVSRFEQADKDIQVSSVLPILDILGMTDNRTVVFPNETFKADFEDRINFWGQEGDKRILFRISHTALEDHFSDREQLGHEGAFKKYRRQIESIARKKYLGNEIETDGSVLIRTDDVV
jgi:transcriptional regulator with XRE-family HTH domain